MYVESVVCSRERERTKMGSWEERGVQCYLYSENEEKGERHKGFRVEREREAFSFIKRLGSESNVCWIRLTLVKLIKFSCFRFLLYFYFEQNFIAF